MPRNFIKRSQVIDRLIQNKATGTSEELAVRIGNSRRTLIEFIDVMKELGAPIYYCRIRKSYCYEEDGSLDISFIKVQ